MLLIDDYKKSIEDLKLAFAEQPDMKHHIISKAIKNAESPELRSMIRKFSSTILP